MAHNLNWHFLRLDEFRKYPEHEMIIHPKDGHPSAFAHKIMAKELSKKIEGIGLS